MACKREIITSEAGEGDTNPGSGMKSPEKTGVTAGTKGGAEGHKFLLPNTDEGGPGEEPEGAAEGAGGATAAAHEEEEPTAEGRSATRLRRLTWP